MRRVILFAAIAAGSVPGTAAGQITGDPHRGGEIYRACIACHSLQPDLHLTGPSLAALFGRKAGATAGYDRYSPGLKSARFDWDVNTLNAWLADPQAMIPGTYMIFRGIDDDQARADLITFLEVATAPGGDEAVVAQNLAPREYVRGQAPEPLTPTPPDQQVTKIRHCRDGFFVTTADGTETPFWEMNVRLKLDTRETGPEPGKPAIVGAGMMGDRVSIVFSSLAELTKFVVEEC
ncbi:MAG: c-type cytochrome [Rhizobiales bacterium]|jgi:cytochrome c|nr:c-type cytochrome [Hyphomicrobiales bacterium]